MPKGEFADGKAFLFSCSAWLGSPQVLLVQIGVGEAEASLSAIHALLALQIDLLKLWEPRFLFLLCARGADIARCWA